MLKYISLIRPHQWIKNLLLLFPPFFAGQISSDFTKTNVILALSAFCAAASCAYLINDIYDIEADRKHHTKRNRSIARGNVSILSAVFFALILFAVAIMASFYVSRWFWAYILLYLIISLSYTFKLKDVVILDIFLISLGFLIRLLAGGEAFVIPVSNWLFMTVFMVSLFLATGKRLGELVSMGKNARQHRKSLAAYSTSYLEGALWFSGSSALVTYALYTLELKSSLFYTVPLAAFGLMRYAFIIKEGKGDPTDALLKDRPIMAVGIVWVLFISYVVYG